MNRHPRHCVLLLVLLLALPLAGTLSVPDAAAESANFVPSPEAQRHLAWRRAEAVAKARLASKLREAQAKMSPGQALYDVHHYDLDLALDHVAQHLDGTVTVTATVTGDSLTAMELDLNGNKETVTAATAGGQPATWSQTQGLLTVDLDRTYYQGETVTVTVTYGGNPDGDYFGWDSHNGEPMIWTLSEPFGARDWWPCKDVNTDKADSVDVRTTVASNLIVASNGLQVSDTDNGDGTHTVHWSTHYPIATYLVSLAIYPYQTWTDWYTPQAGGSSMPVEFFVFPDHYASLLPNYNKTVGMIDAFAQAFGEYPFLAEKYGHAEFLWGGGMEHQTITSLGGWWEYVIAHELAHQWWGDAITCADFHHIWLNEGFATWCEAYWREVTEGWSGYHDEMMAAAYKGPGTIYVEDTSNFWGIFDGNLSYNKASWVVHMLRGILGDDAFFAGLRQYLQQYGYGTATTEQFRDVMEAAGGRDLDAFFQQWIYGEYYPVYDWSWEPATLDGGPAVHVAISQAQTNTGLFDQPVWLRVTTTAGTVDTLLENNQRVTDYLVPVPGSVQAVALDPDDWVLCDKQEIVSTATGALPAVVTLGAIHPNPFNPRTVIPYSLSRDGRVELAVYDLAGRRVRTLLDGTRAAGPGEAVWTGCDDAGRPVPSGTYLVRLRAGDAVAVRRAVLAR